jgi:uncharacterized integral membrane protein
VNRQKAKAVGVGVVLVALAVVVLQNTASVKTTILFWSTQMPQAILLFITGAVGYAVGGVVATRKKK